MGVPAAQPGNARGERQPVLGSVDGPTTPRTGGAGPRRVWMVGLLHFRSLSGRWVTALPRGGDEAASHRPKASGPPSTTVTHGQPHGRRCEVRLCQRHGAGQHFRALPGCCAPSLTGVCGCCVVAQLGPALCDRMDCSLSDSSVHGLSQARILQWVAVPSSRGSSRPRD